MERKEYTLVGSTLVEKEKPAQEEQKVDLPAPVLPVLTHHEEELEVKESNNGS